MGQMEKNGLFIDFHGPGNSTPTPTLFCCLYAKICQLQKQRQNSSIFFQSLDARPIQWNEQVEQSMTQFTSVQRAEEIKGKGKRSEMGKWKYKRTRLFPWPVEVNMGNSR